jgi:pimeloyl-ACP methyl ester carboxylesterase
VDLPGGLHVHYEDEGDPSLPLLVLLHGYGDSYTSWDGWVRALKDKFHIIRLDFPGHGLTRASADALHDISVPTLVLQGENDVLVEPASAAKFAAAIPGAKLILYPHVGHLPQIEIPQRSAADVAQFLQGRR